MNPKRNSLCDKLRQICEQYNRVFDRLVPGHKVNPALRETRETRDHRERPEIPGHKVNPALRETRETRDPKANRVYRGLKATKETTENL